MDFYSASNAILIMSRCPDATLLKSADSWNELDVKINKGEKAIHILEPSDYIDENGEQRTSYNIKNVFDISQTDAEPKPPQKTESNPKVLAVSLMETAPMQKVNAAELPIPYSTAFYDHDNNKLHLLLSFSQTAHLIPLHSLPMLILTTDLFVMIFLNSAHSFCLWVCLLYLIIF